MTSLLEPPTLAVLDDLEEQQAPEVAEDERAVAPVTLALAAVSGALSSAGAAWMIGGVFRGTEARLVGFLGVLLGAGLSWAAVRWRSPVLSYLVLPASLVLGAVLMSSASGAGTSSLPSLVKDAATSSQVLQPPVDFAPGWRLILLVVLALLSSAACSLALSLRRPRLAVAVPAPLTVVAALVQPAGTAVTTGAVAVGFVLMALATSYAADGVGETFDTGFEVRRLLRSLLAGALLVAGLIAASKVSFLFPQQESHRVVPPRRPPVSPPQKDVPLYTAKGDLPGPLRVGVIDVYDLTEQAWLLPPVDNQRLQRLELPADLPGAPVESGPQQRTTIRVEQARGRLLPSVAGARRVEGQQTVDLDPRTNGLSLANRPVFTGLSYDVVSNPPPNGQQLSRSTGAVPADVQEFLTAPPVPPAVEALLRKAPAQPYARLQALRNELYAGFTAAGAGKPTDVGPDRVVELLGEGTGNPYELTASEALLARWAGIPSRIGFGYSGGTKTDDGIELHPKDAATYLEAYFAPYGWVAVVGTPPKAQQSLTNSSRDNDASIQASPELGLNVLLPVRRDNRLPLYTYVRYYLLRVLPVLVALGALLLVYPVVLKRVRRRRRARWAAGHGPAGIVAVAYCDFRDALTDLALPAGSATPLELVEGTVEDEEHAELAWLVTRGLWGDLRRDLGDHDAQRAVALAASVTSRARKAQPETARLLAAVSRASLRAPYSLEVPNVWWQLRRPRLPSLRPSAATSLLVALAVLLTGGCSSDGQVTAEPVLPFPSRLAPTLLAGLQSHEEPKAAEAYDKGAKDRNVIVDAGKVVSFSRGGLVQAALQVAQLKRGYTSDDPEVVDAITRSVGKVEELDPQQGHALYASTDGSQRIYLWFPTQKAMSLLVLRTAITEGASEALARALVDYGLGGEVDEPALAAAVAAVPDANPTPSPEKTP